MLTPILGIANPVVTYSWIKEDYMVSKFAPKREKFLVNKSDIKEEMKRMVDIAPEYFITPSGKVYREYTQTAFYERKPYLNKKNGYNYVTLFNKYGKRTTYRLHRLVAIYFIPNPNNYPVVGHKDNNKSRYDVDDLYWTSYSENTQKAVNDGLLINDKGYADSQSIPVIVFDAEHNEIDRIGSFGECSKKYRVSKSTIARHCNHEIKGKTRCGYYFEYDNEFIN